MAQSRAGTTVTDDVEYCSACGRPTQLTTSLLAEIRSRSADVDGTSASLPVERPPLSGLAIAALVAAALSYTLVVLSPVADWASSVLPDGLWLGLVGVTGLSALALGVSGAVATRGGRRRGLGLAITAILIIGLPFLAIVLVLLAGPSTWIGGRP